MLICIDSNQFVFGVMETDTDAVALMDILPQIDVVVPRLVISEVVRNLEKIGLEKQFFATIYRSERFQIIDEPVPIQLVEKYVASGLPAKADAIIGAFAEWMGAQYLISDNRHFLQELTTDAFEVLTPGEFLDRFSGGSEGLSK